MDSGTAICTWFVADDAKSATHFPQVGAMSDTPKAQATYWRCTVVFFASSLAVNPNARHLFFTNVQPPVIDGLDIAAWLARNGVETVVLPIVHRLAPGAVERWGNQFFVFDIIDWLAAHDDSARAIILDSDCLWLKPVDAMAASIDRHGALTYEITEADHARDEPINGLTRQQMARFFHAHGGGEELSIPYYGGEIVAARIELLRRIAGRTAVLWPAVLAQGADAPREEAHLLSVIYALEGVERGTADPYLRRMWTTFHYNDLRLSDRDLTIWHLPAEKRTGFARAFALIARNALADPRTHQETLGLTIADYARTMGWPRRSPAKFARDLLAKLAEKTFA